MRKPMAGGVFDPKSGRWLICQVFPEVQGKPRGNDPLSRMIREVRRELTWELDAELTERRGEEI